MSVSENAWARQSVYKNTGGTQADNYTKERRMRTNTLNSDGRLFQWAPEGFFDKSPATHSITEY